MKADTLRECPRTTPCRVSGHMIVIMQRGGFGEKTGIRTTTWESDSSKQTWNWFKRHGFVCLWNEPFIARVGNTRVQPITGRLVHQHVWTWVTLLWKQDEVFSMEPSSSSSCQRHCRFIHPGVNSQHLQKANDMTFSEFTHIQLCLWTIRGKSSSELYIGLRSMLNFPSLCSQCSKAFRNVIWPFLFVLREQKSWGIIVRCYILALMKTPSCEEKTKDKAMSFSFLNLSRKRWDQSAMEQGQLQTLFPQKGVQIALQCLGSTHLSRTLKS